MQFFPSPDYLEAGKFKIQRSLNASRIVGSDIENVAQAKQLYRESYDQILAVSDDLLIFNLLYLI
jgi:hypothetical protein